MVEQWEVPEIKNMYNADKTTMNYRINKQNHYIEIDTELLYKEDHNSLFNYLCSLGFSEEPWEQHLQVFPYCNGSFYVHIRIRSQKDVEIWNDNLNQIKDKYNSLYIKSDTKRKNKREKRESEREYRTTLMKMIQ